MTENPYISVGLLLRGFAGAGGTINVDANVTLTLGVAGGVANMRTNGGGYQGILIDPKTGVLHGGTEARKDGVAVGY